MCMFNHWAAGLRSGLLPRIVLLQHHPPPLKEKRDPKFISLEGNTYFGHFGAGKAHEKKIKNVPSEGPLMIVANHPFGVLDGLVICWLTSKIRSEFKVLTHSLLLRASETKDYLLPIDFSENKDAMNVDLHKAVKFYKQKQILKIRKPNYLL